MAKLWAHHRAALGIPVAQRSQGQIQALLQGHLLLRSSSFCLPFGNEALDMVRSRRVLRRPVHAHNAAAAASYVQRAEIHRQRWVRHLRQKPRRKQGSVKRTIFTKKSKDDVVEAMDKISYILRAHPDIRPDNTEHIDI